MNGRRNLLLSSLTTRPFIISAGGLMNEFILLWRQTSEQETVFNWLLIWFQQSLISALLMTDAVSFPPLQDCDLLSHRKWFYKNRGVGRESYLPPLLKTCFLMTTETKGKKPRLLPQLVGKKEKQESHLRCLNIRALS